MPREGFTPIPPFPLRLRQGRFQPPGSTPPYFPSSALFTLRFPPPGLCLCSGGGWIGEVRPPVTVHALRIQTP